MFFGNKYEYKKVRDVRFLTNVHKIKGEEKQVGDLFKAYEKNGKEYKYTGMSVNNRLDRFKHDKLDLKNQRTILLQAHNELIEKISILSKECTNIMQKVDSINKELVRKREMCRETYIKIGGESSDNEQKHYEDEINSESENDLKK